MDSRPVLLFSLSAVLSAFLPLTAGAVATASARAAFEAGHSMPVRSFHASSPDRFRLVLDSTDGRPLEIEARASWEWDGVAYMDLRVGGEPHVLARYEKDGETWLALDDDPLAYGQVRDPRDRAFLDGLAKRLAEEAGSGLRTMGNVDIDMDGYCPFCGARWDSLKTVANIAYFLITKVEWEVEIEFEFRLNGRLKAGRDGSNEPGDTRGGGETEEPEGDGSSSGSGSEGSGDAGSGSPAGDA